MVLEGENPIQEEQVSEETPPEETQEQPFSPEQEARMEQLIAEAATRAREEGKREMQSAKDREVAAARKEAQRYQAEIDAYRTGFGNLDEETQREIETARIRSENQYYRKTQEEATEQERKIQADQELAEKTYNEFVEYLKPLNIDPKDERLNWSDGEHISNIGVISKNFYESVASIRKEGTMTEKIDMEKLKAEIKAEVLREAGLESVPAGTSPGGEKTDLDEIIEGYGEGTYTRAQYEDAMRKKGLEP